MSFFPRSCFLALTVLSILCLQFASPSHARAASFEIYPLHSDQGYHFYGMDDTGLVVITNGNPYTGPGSCGNTSCFWEYLNGSLVNTVNLAPQLVPDNGTPCSPSAPAGDIVLYGVCNNGRSAFVGFVSPGQSQAGAYAGTGFTNFLGLAGGEIYMNALGDIVFDDVYNSVDTYFEAIPTPEPSSLVLLLTGVTGAGLLLASRRAIV